VTWRLRTAKGRTVELPPLPAVLGSGADTDLRLRHPSLAARHARVTEPADGELLVTTLDMSAQLSVDGRAVPAARVKPGGSFTLGTVVFVVERGAEGGGAAARAGGASAASGASKANAPPPPGPRPSRAAQQAARLRAQAGAARPAAARGAVWRADFAQIGGPLRWLVLIGGLAAAGALAWGLWRVVGG